MNTILVVDEQVQHLELTRQLLQQEGYRVLVATSGNAALALFKENDVHLLLINHALPCMKGQGLIRRIREVDPYVQIILVADTAEHAPPRRVLSELDIQGYHNSRDGTQRLLLWVRVGLKTFNTVSALRQREQQQSRMVSNVSHEIKNPVALICGLCELIADGTLGAVPEDAQKPLSALLQTAKRLGELVDNFLLYAKLEAGAMNVALHPMPSSKLAQELHNLGSSLVKGRDVRVSVEVGEGASWLTTDALKVQAILRNLVHNAAKFTSNGEIAVQIERRDDALCFVVRDTGIGIPREDREKVFEPFRQLDGSMTRSHGGVGLGLALSRKLARLLGGDIEVDGGPGIGSTFTLRLPDGRKTEEEVDPDHQRSRAPAHAEAGPTLAV